MFQDVLKDIRSFEWWFTAGFMGLGIGVLAHFIFKYLDRFFSKRSLKSKEKFDLKKTSDEKMINYYAADFNLLSMKNSKFVYTFFYIALLLILTTMLMVALILDTVHPDKFYLLPILILSVIAIGAVGYFFHRHKSDLNITQRATQKFIDNNTIGKYFPGKWYLIYSKPNSTGNERVEIKDGNKYYANDTVRFIIKNFQIDTDTKQMTFEKHTPEKLHSKETLQIENDKLYTGSGTTGYSLKYERID
jgi:hypothetical protein